MKNNKIRIKTCTGQKTEDEIPVLTIPFLKSEKVDRTPRITRSGRKESVMVEISMQFCYKVWSHILAGKPPAATKITSGLSLAIYCIEI
jgi:hypothetical protein